MTEREVRQLLVMRRGKSRQERRRKLEFIVPRVFRPAIRGEAATALGRIGIPVTSCAARRAHGKPKRFPALTLRADSINDTAATKKALASKVIRARGA